VITLAAILTALTVALAGPVPALLAASPTALRRPGWALLTWQILGATSGLAAIGAFAAFALTRHPLAGAAKIAAVGLTGYLLAVTATVTWQTLRRRAAHRELLDLVSTPLPELPGGRLLDAATPSAYCLPGRRSRLVLTAGAIDALEPTALAAVIAHERAHLSQRHDLVALPFTAWQAAWPFLPGARTARAAVDLLIEALADDTACACVGAPAVTQALRTVRLRSASAEGPFDLQVRLARLAAVQPV